MSPVAVHDLMISAWGLSTPIGRTAASTWAAWAANIDRHEEIEVPGLSVEDVRLSRLSSIPNRASRLERMLYLADDALSDWARNLGRSHAGEVVVCLGVPEESPGGKLSADELQRLCSGVQRRVEMLVGCKSCRVVPLPYGRSAGLYALQHAVEAISSHPVRLCLVGGVDSLCAVDVISLLEDEGRLSETDGLTPGEAAAFLSVEVSGSNGQPVARIGGLALERSSSSLDEARICDAQALTESIQRVRTSAASLGLDHADLLLTLENGERFWSEELAQAYIRNVPIMPEPLVKTAVHENFGDPGAASATLMTVLGIEQLTRVGDNSQGNLLVCGSSDSGHCGACLVTIGVSTTTRRGGRVA